jgi:hypothetical protein
VRQTTSIDIPFPRLGLIESTARREQPELSAYDVKNMRYYSPTSGRGRGAQRSGLGKWSSAQIAGASGRIQNLNHVVTIQASTEAQGSMQIRTTYPVAVMAGKVRLFSSSASLTPTGVSDPDLLATAPFIMSEVMNQKVWFCDGTNYRKYDPVTGSNGTVSAWTAATAGTIPANGADVARLMCTWNNRMVLSGIKSDPQNIFMSAKGDPENFDYNPTPNVATQAVAYGTTKDLTKLPEPVMSLMPFNKDIMFIGGDHSIYVQSGDPMLGGIVELVSDITGTAFGPCWCKDPIGNIYFFGSRGGVYRIPPGGVPERITANRFEHRLANINLDTNLVSLAWNDEAIGVEVYVTNLAGRPSEHYFYDQRSDAWFRDVFDNDNHNPCAVHVFDGDDVGDRVTWIGGQDGYVRYKDRQFNNDDGTAIDSFVVIGPVQSEGGNVPFIVTAVQGILPGGSSDAYWELSTDIAATAARINVGGFLLQETGDKILLEDLSGFILLDADTTYNETGTFTALSRIIANPMRSGYAAYLLVGNNTLGERWEMEYVRMTLSVAPTSRGSI